MGLTPVHAKDQELAEPVLPMLAEPVGASEGPSRPIPVPVVRRMQVGAADDHAEKSADMMADAALSRLAGAGGSDGDQHRHGAGCEHVRRSAIPGAGGGGTGVAPVVGFAGGALDGDTEAKINSTRGRGDSLAAPVRRDMEQAFGRSFDAVRVHDNENSAGLNKAISARAFTTGNDIYFGAGQYRPQDPDGQRVLAHELAHVVQDGGSVQRLFGFGGPKRPQVEIDAEAAKAVLAKQAAKVEKEGARVEKKAVADAVKANKVDLAERKKNKAAGVTPALVGNVAKPVPAARPVIGAARLTPGAGPARPQAVAPGVVSPGAAPGAVPAAPGAETAAPGVVPAAPPTPGAGKSREDISNEKMEAMRAAAAGDAQQTKILNKGAAKSSRTTLAAYDERQRLEGAQNLVDRADLSETVQEDQGESSTSALANQLNHELEGLLAEELEAIEAIGKAKPAVTKDKVLALAYQQIWMNPGLSKAMQAVRPNRSTEAARLAWATRAEISKEAMDGDAGKPLEIAPLGSMLRKRTERVYEQIETAYEKEYAALRSKKALAHMDDEKLQNQARRVAKRNLTPEELALLPTNPAIDAQAAVDARARLKLRKTPIKVAPPGTSADAVVDMLATDGTIATIGQVGAKAVTAPLGLAGSKLDSAANPGGRSGGLEEALPGGLGNAIKTGAVAHESLASGNRSGKLPDTHQSNDTLAALGIGQSKDILLDAAAAITSIRNLLEAFSSDDKSLRNKKKIAQEMANTGAAAMSAAVDSAKLAATISEGVTGAVASVVPGLNIAVTFLKLTSKVLEVADIGQRMSSVNDKLDEAHERKPGRGLDVLVYPLIGIQESFVKKLEMVVWDAGMAVLSFSTAIATVASAGGFGIPAAIDASAKVLDLLHSAGHFIADSVLASMAQDARRNTGNAIEGAAERQLRNDPSAAVNAMVMAARQGNAHASSFIESFGVTPADIKTLKIVEISAPILKIMGKDADPQTAFDKFENGLKAAGAVHDKWAQTGSMAKQRDEVDGKKGTAFDLGLTSRGILWRLNMMLKSDMKHKRSMLKTQVIVAADPVMGPRDRAAAAAIEAAKPKVGSFVETDVLGTVGGVRLLKNPNEGQKLTFAGQLAGMDEKAITSALSDPSNAESFKTLLAEILSEKIKKKAAATAVPAIAAGVPAAAGAPAAP